jgi:transcriptional regulator with XRE-family HTH domain
MEHDSRRDGAMYIQQQSELGQIAHQRRMDLGLTQLEVAARLGVTRQWLSRFENGIGESSLAKVFLVLRELDLAIDIRPKTADSATTATSELPHSRAIQAASRAALARLAASVGGREALALAKTASFNLDRVEKNLRLAQPAEDDDA